MAIMMIIIYLFSAMEGDDSAQTSGMFLNAIKKLAEEVSHRGLSPEALSNLHFIIRKCAHFTEYAALGITIMYAFWCRFKDAKLSFLWPELIAFSYATTDEIHQYFVPGRYGTFGDVMIDSSGALVGILVYWIIYKKKRVKNETL